MKSSYDVIVVGAGAWGSAAALQVADRGCRVLCLDRFVAPHEFGSTYGHSRVLRWSASSPEVHALQVRSRELWRDLEMRTDSTLLTRTGCVYAGAETQPMLGQALASYREGDPAFAVMGADEAPLRFPWLRLQDGEVAVFESEAGVIDPEGSVTAALTAAAGAGAEIRFEEPMATWKASGDEVEVITSTSRYVADSVVLALGAWSPELIRWDLPLVIQRHVMAWYADRDRRTDCVFVCATESPDDVFYGAPEPAGRVKVAVHGDGVEIAGPEALQRTIDDEDIAGLRHYVESRVPHLAGEPVGARACMYTKSPDWRFAIGRHPESPRVIVATGESGGGMQLAPAVGELIADLVTGEREDLGFLSPTRFSELADVPAT